MKHMVHSLAWFLPGDGGFVSHVEVLLDPFNHVVLLPAGPGAALILML